ncbi:hypothetical protein DFR50_13939 [Roseiarcus fermentans]|uniref:PIN domain-containing protein n=1 Tax=Roseiarcus fermentans TaxID=1473586 RepID=A0A366EQ72_9HYPH|nr:hypothetical protein [Roseiarcus fermentans]RBP04562.1 hypothetical protein DFR50_13939 [Roseiarcus fermentans]
MKFWDASAIVPLLVEEAGTELVTALLARDPGGCGVTPRGLCALALSVASIPARWH